MGKWKEKPRYNIVTVRISDEALAAIERMSKGTNRSIVLNRAIEELIQRDEAAAFRRRVEAKRNGR